MLLTCHNLFIFIYLKHSKLSDCHMSNKNVKKLVDNDVQSFITSNIKYCNVNISYF